MKVGDMIRMVTGYPDHLSNPHNVGLLISINVHRRGYKGRVATVMTNSNELVMWPLDSRYEIKVINDIR